MAFRAVMALCVLLAWGGAAQADVEFCREGWDRSTTEISCDLDEAVDELDALAKLPNLRRVQLNIAGMTSVASLAGAKKLEELALVQTQVADLSPLAGLKHLRIVSVTGGGLKDLAPAATWPALEVVQLTGVPVKDVAPLAGLPKLRMVVLDGTGVTDLSPLARVRTLTFFQLKGGAVDLSPVSGLPIVDLHLRETCPKGLDAEGAFAAVASLTLAPSCPLDVKWLPRWPKLRSVTVASKAVTRLSDLGLAPGAPVAWDTLVLSDSGLTGLDGLGALPRMTYLNLSQNPVADVGPLAAMTQLEVVDLSGTKVTDVTPLASLPKLRNLWLMDTAIADLSPLTKLRKLEQLFLRGTPAKDDPKTLAKLKRASRALELYLE